MRICYFLSCITILLLVSCKSEPEEVDAEVSPEKEEVVLTKEQFRYNRMELGELAKKDFPEIVHANGQIEVPPENLARINVFEGGYVKRIPLMAGSEVKRGQLVLSLEDPRYVELQQEYRQLAEQLTYLKAEFDRQQVMLNENITSRKKFLLAESDYKSALARYNGLRKKLEMMNIDPKQVEAGNVTSQINVYAPISGSVDNVNASTGMFVEPTFTVMEIINTDHIHLKIQVFEKDLMKIQKEQKIRFSIPQAPLTTYEAKVWLVGKTINESRTAEVHADLADSIKDRFAVGMFVEAQIITNSNAFYALPTDAIVEVDNSHYVLVLENRTADGYVFSRQQVSPQKTFQGFTSIENPDSLKGKRILIKGAFTLIEN